MIAMDLGLCQEATVDKIRGYLVNSVDEGVQAVGKIERSRRWDIREMVICAKSPELSPVFD